MLQQMGDLLLLEIHSIQMVIKVGKTMEDVMEREVAPLGQDAVLLDPDQHKSPIVDLMKTRI